MTTKQNIIRMYGINLGYGYSRLRYIDVSREECEEAIVNEQRNYKGKSKNPLCNDYKQQKKGK